MECVYWLLDGRVTEEVDGPSLDEIPCVDARPTLQQKSPTHTQQDCVRDSELSVRHLENNNSQPW